MSQMKSYKFLVLTLVFIQLFSVCFATYAHSGNTDENGGHYNHATESYHYHHGYPEHQHKNGTCPYKIYNSAGDNKKASVLDILIYIIFFSPLLFYFFFFIFPFIFSELKSLILNLLKKRK